MRLETPEEAWKTYELLSGTLGIEDPVRRFYEFRATMNMRSDEYALHERLVLQQRGTMRYEQ